MNAVIQIFDGTTMVMIAGKRKFFKTAGKKVHDEDTTMRTTKTRNVIVNGDEDEPLFVLRAQDVSSPRVVIDWIRENFDTAPPDKLLAAFDVALQMKAYPVEKKKRAD